MNARGLVAIVAAMALTSCETGPSVQTDSDPSADFSKYHTYSWVYQDVPAGMNPLVYQRTRQSIDNQMAAKGFTQSNTPDMAVAFTLGARDRVQIDDFGPYAPFYPGARFGWRAAAYGWGYNDVDVRNVTDGTLVIDFYDAATKMPIWHGVASETVNSTASVDQADIDQAVSSVLAAYPT